MKKLLLIVIATLLLISCSNNYDFKPIKIEYDDEKIKNLQEDIAVDGYSKLKEKFNGIGLTVIESGKHEHPLLKGNATYMKLSNDMLLQVYEYDNGKSLFEGIISISDDGYGISEIKQGEIVGGTDIEWVDQPNFYRFKNLIILYVGRNEIFIDFLNEISDEEILK